ncbi:Cut9-interacting protein scn1 [Podospora australis]|uniref:Cut9-interacting protein scn1 n=1 Tax=Podospora australis TaxID=1536484 RepID=A0AAN6X1N6_9PEZI|nr:Cut9-interacting protein scn1 [Podospora australis]
MCGQNEEPRDDAQAADFPWELGVFDAHCHPTDTMSSIATIKDMRARVLTVMATRSQDQDLVASVAAKQGIKDSSALATQDQSNKLVPAFGWHPWFSHQLFDDTAEGNNAYDPANPTAEGKEKHYQAVLNPAPDHDFIASLPDPVSLKGFLAETRRRLADAPLALIGEVGIDKQFRLPVARSEGDPVEREEGLTPGGREGRRLSPYHVKMQHQVQILKAQLQVAGELGRAASVHGVQAHGVLFDALASLWKGHEKEVVSRRKQKLVAKGAEDFSSGDEDEDEDSGVKTTASPKSYTPKPFPPRVCLHSFSGSSQLMAQYLNPAIPARIFFSFSTAINLSTAGGEKKFPEVLRACPDDRILIESDLHTAGNDMDFYLQSMYRKVCEVKGWTLEDGVKRIRKNYEEFIFG